MKLAILFLLFSSSAVAQNNTVYIDQIGHNNNYYVDQKDGGGKSLSIVNEGELNTLNVLQQGIGQHSSSITSINGSVNNNNNFTVNQSGAGNHIANITLTNPTTNSTNTASITQSGSANKQFNLNLDGNGIGATILQNNPIVPDSASMSITCLSPPCSGYSYTKN